MTDTPGTRHRLMVVDPELGHCTQLGRSITTLGHDVITQVPAGLEAIEAAARCAPDLVVMNARLPGTLNGPAVARVLAANYGIPSIVFGPDGEGAVVDRGPGPRPYEVLRQPFGLYDLAGAIGRAFGRSIRAQGTAATNGGPPAGNEGTHTMSLPRWREPGVLPARAATAAEGIKTSVGILTPGSFDRSPRGRPIDPASGPPRRARKRPPPMRTDGPETSSRQGIWLSRRQHGNGGGPGGKLECAAAPTFEATTTGRITDANGALATLLGYSTRQKLLTLSLEDLFTDNAVADQLLAYTRQGQRLDGEEVVLRTKMDDDVVVLLSTKRTDAVRMEDRRIVGTAIGITRRKARESKLEQFALADPLTGMANRRALEEHATKYLALARRRNMQMGLILLDLSRFEAINDRHGRAAGDGVLVEVARRLGREARGTDVVARIGGDEFVVLLANVTGRNAAVQTARRLKESVEGTPFDLDEGKQLPIRSEAGLSLCPRHGDDLEALLDAADQAMSLAKHDDGDRTPRAGDAGISPPIVAPAADATSSPSCSLRTRSSFEPGSIRAGPAPVEGSEEGGD